MYQKFSCTRSPLVHTFKFHLNPFGERSLETISDIYMTKFLPKACPLNTSRLQPALMFSRRKGSAPALQHATWVDNVNVTWKLRVSSLKHRGFSPSHLVLSNIVDIDFVPRFPIVSICSMLRCCECFEAIWRPLTPPFSRAPLLSSGSTFSIVV